MFQLKGDIDDVTSNSYFLKGSISYKKNKWITSGGRVLNAVAFGPSQTAAINRAYQQVQKNIMAWYALPS